MASGSERKTEKCNNNNEGAGVLMFGNNQLNGG